MLYPLSSDIDLEYCRASAGKRFLNYVIDLIAFYIIFLGILIAVSIISPGIFDNINSFVDRLITLVCYGLIMGLIEAAANGKSLGKLITGTKAVNTDGTEIDFQKAFMRNIIRSIPFNALSALGTPSNPWHDKWSDTIVVDEKKVALIERKETFFDLLNENKED